MGLGELKVSLECPAEAGERSCRPDIGRDPTLRCQNREES